MRFLTLTTVAVSLTITGPTFAKASSSHPHSSVAAASTSSAAMKDCASQWQAMKKAGTAKGTYKDFSKTCLAKSGQPAAVASNNRTQGQSRLQQVGPTPSATPAPAASAPTPSAKATGDAANPAGAEAKCKDGAYSHAKTHTGACSHHGGVAQWLK
jgi:hypothetical protein